MTEEWKSIPGTRYEASTEGRIRHEERRIPLPGSVSTSGYRTVGIYFRGSPKHKYVHRLVAHAFLGPCPDGKQVNHIDGHKLNNRPENLEYLTPKEHEYHTTHIVKLARRVNGSALGPAAKLTEAKVREIHHLYSTGQYRIKDLARMFGIGPAQAGLIIKGGTWKHLGLESIPTRDYARRNEDHPRSKLSSEQREQVRNLHDTGLSAQKIARQLNVEPGVIYRYLRKVKSNLT